MSSHSSYPTLNKNTFTDNYVIEDEIGVGGNGIIYKALQCSTGQSVAIKTVKFNNDTDGQKASLQIARFEREARLCAELNHPNIVKILDKGFSGENEPFVVFEYISGSTLKDYIFQKKGLSLKETGDIMGQVMDALVYAHRKGIVHRDLNPYNIMVTNLDTKVHARILDFGISLFTHDNIHLNSKNKGLTGDLMGTPSYSAPEQLRGEPCTVKSDFYSWGLIFIECLTGKPVVSGKSIAEIFKFQLSPLEVSIPDILNEQPIGKFLSKVLEKDKNKRPESALEIYKEFVSINLSDIKAEPEILSEVTDNKDYTVANDLLLGSALNSRKQITVLALKLSISVNETFYSDIDILGTILKDQLAICRDTVIKYGGLTADSQVNYLLTYFGYPESDDTVARRAAKAALELISGVNKRSVLLENRYQIKLDISICLHSGVVLCQPNSDPVGVVPYIAMEMLRYAKPGNVLFSDTSKKLLDPYLDFEEAQNISFFNGKSGFRTYNLIGERFIESLSSSRKWTSARSFIGRETEKADITNLCRKQLSFNGKAILVKGQAGIGKSRLVFEVKREIQENKYFVLESRCLPENSNNALSPFLQLLRIYWGIGYNDNVKDVISGIEKTLRHVECYSGEIMSLICSWLSVPLPDNYPPFISTPEEQKNKLFFVLKSCIYNINNRKPFLLIIEDLHWIDITSQLFLEYLLAEVDKGPLMILMTTRPWNAETKMPETVVKFELQPFSNDQAQHLIENILENKPIFPQALDYILEKSDKIPFFIEEFTSMLLDRKYLVFDNDKYKLVKDIEEKAVPVTLSDLLNNRLDQIGSAKETAQIAGSIGREFTYELLVKCSLKDEAQVQEDLNRMMKADLIYSRKRIKGDSYVFRHALIQDAACESMVPAYRKQVHGFIAEALINSEPEFVKENSFEIGRHLAEAGLFEDATAFSLKAIETFIERRLYKETTSIVNYARLWIEKITNPGSQKAAQLRLNDVLVTILLNTEGHGTAKFADIYYENIQLISYFTENCPGNMHADFSDILLKSECLYLNHLHVSNQRSKAWTLAESVLPKVEKLKDYKLRFMVWASMGQMYLCEGMFKESEKLLKLLTDEGCKRRDYNLFYSFGFDPVSMSLGNLACIMAVNGNFSKAVKYVNRGIDYACQLNNPIDIVIAYVFKGLVLGYFDEQKEVKKLLVELKQKYGDILENCWASCYLSFIEDWAVEETEKSYAVRKLLIDVHQDALLTWYELLMAQSLIKKHEYQKAFQLMSEAEERNIARNESCLLSMVYAYMGVSYAQTENVQLIQLQDYFSKAISIAEKQDDSWLVLNALHYYHQSLQKFEEPTVRLVEKARLLLNSYKPENSKSRDINNYFTNLKI
jgi:TOMM system kinase/cyclase fusion protein